MTGHITPYGFEWGPIEVTRASIFNGSRLLYVKTLRDDDRTWHNLQIVVSPTGRSVRVYMDGKKMQ